MARRRISGLEFEVQYEAEYYMYGTVVLFLVRFAIGRGEGAVTLVKIWAATHVWSSKTACSFAKNSVYYRAFAWPPPAQADQGHAIPLAILPCLVILSGIKAAAHS